MQIRRAAPADAAVVADLARATFFDTFAASNNPTDMALHLERAYGAAQQEAEIVDPAIVTLLVEDAGVAIAYAQIRAGHAPEGVADHDAVELWRFYVARQWHGRGVAQQLMEHVKQEARAQGAKTLWLGVWERNDRARAFYSKCGFEDVGAHVFLFGTDPQTDRVMVAAV